MRNHSLNVRSVFGTFAIILVLVIALAACGGGSSGDDDVGGESSRSSDGTFLESGGGSEPYDANDSESGKNEAASAPGSGVGVASIDYVANQVPFDHLIIRTVTISLTVESVTDGATWIRDLAARKSGFVFSSNTYVRDESEFAQMTIRVPASELDSTVRELREHQLVIQVDSEESTSQDVSQEYVDNESRLVALEETQRRFLALLSDADTVDDILRIESELTNIRTQIETIKGRQNYLDQMTSMSTVTITLHAENTNPIDADQEKNFIARIFGDSWDSASGVIEGILAGTITIGIIGLAILPFALILYLIGRIAFRRLNVGTGNAAASEETVAEPIS
jgi:Domain of unknown function (DUF4349)